MSDKEYYKYWQIDIEGIDKTSKDTLRRYIDIVCGHKYEIFDRGILSDVAYDKIFKRKHREYRFSDALLDERTWIYLLADEEDWNIRCLITNEPKISYSEHLAAFDETVEDFKKKGARIWTYNTSEMTPIMIARDVVKRMAELNNLGD